MPSVILVVDDEPLVLDVVAQSLQKAGFSVLRANTPAMALRIATEREPGTIDLLLTDVVMPGLSGPGLAERVIGLHPGIQCVFMAGLANTTEVFERILKKGLAFIPKPFQPDDLLLKVRDTLSGPPPQAAVGV